MSVVSLTGVAMNKAGSAFNANGPTVYGTIADAAATQSVPILLVSGTTMPGDPAYSSSYSDISDITPASTTSKNRISWLG